MESIFSCSVQGHGKHLALQCITALVEYHGTPTFSFAEGVGLFGYPVKGFLWLVAWNPLFRYDPVSVFPHVLLEEPYVAGLIVRLTLSEQFLISMFLSSTSSANSWAISMGSLESLACVLVHPSFLTNRSKSEVVNQVNLLE
ncbi:hypothetical protein ACE6H2_020243 [Prunus campanulata]